MARRLGSLASSSAVPVLSDAPAKRRADRRKAQTDITVDVELDKVQLSAGMSLRQILEADEVEDDPGEVQNTPTLCGRRAMDL